jgi:hypothetical protein
MPIKPRDGAAEALSVVSANKPVMATVAIRTFPIANLLFQTGVNMVGDFA